MVRAVAGLAEGGEVQMQVAATEVPAVAVKEVVGDVPKSQGETDKKVVEVPPMQTQERVVEVSETQAVAGETKFAAPGTGGRDGGECAPGARR